MAPIVRRSLTAALAGSAAILAGAAQAQVYDPQYPPPPGYAPPPNGPGYGQAPYEQAGVSISVNFAPPPLPVYDQPPPPGPDFIWQPGYWAWDEDDGDYFWVPGAWIEAPEPGLLWTPAWWGFDDGVYVFHEGYWGPEVGWYGGVDYGCGYWGHGYEGGYWRGDHFFYNSLVNNVAGIIAERLFEGGHHDNDDWRRGREWNGDRGGWNGQQRWRASFNGPGGVQDQPQRQELAADQQRRFAPTAAQMQHAQAAMRQPNFRAGVNNGAPPVAATVQAGQFRGPGVVGAAAAGAGFQPRVQNRQPGMGGQPFAPRRNAPAYQPPQQPFNAPAYQPPQQRFNAPAYQPPQQRFNAPASQPPQQRFNAPAYQPPQQRFQAPAYQPPRPAPPQGYAPVPRYQPPAARQPAPPAQRKAPPPKDDKRPN